ncbi:hypothetical protein EX30DRAFT_38359 [Ascodesmis nigricans]|uniref:Uncharacterized protein n=1 Tax=Ascodesmis nigricans TaxID=341454 RepID=A0A4S2MWV1_9PEZI|nr:hypothetical protein EX30DRAFT_38359 [Ascodesmis nigricans]
MTFHSGPLRSLRLCLPPPKSLSVHWKKKKKTRSCPLFNYLPHPRTATSSRPSGIIMLTPPPTPSNHVIYLPNPFTTPISPAGSTISSLPSVPLGHGANNPFRPGGEGWVRAAEKGITLSTTTTPRSSQSGQDSPASIHGDESSYAGGAAKNPFLRPFTPQQKQAVIRELERLGIFDALDASGK